MIPAKFSRKDWEVRTVPLSVARNLVERFHYAQGGANTAVFRHGLFLVGGNEPLGVAWWLPPTKVAAAATFPEGDWRRVLALSRLVIDPRVPTNGASFLIAQSIKLIRATGDWDCLVTYADEGQGHTGAIYKATNWQYVGRTAREARWVDKDGRMVARKAGPKSRTQSEMRDLGYEIQGRYTKHKFRMVLNDRRHIT